MSDLDDFFITQLLRIHKLPLHRPYRVRQSGVGKGNSHKLHLHTTASKRQLMKLAHEGYEADRVLQRVHGWPERAVGCEVESRR